MESKQDRIRRHYFEREADRQPPYKSELPQEAGSEHFSDQLYAMADRTDGEASDALRKAGDLVGMIDRECSLCKPYKTLPDRVQTLILEANL